MNRASGLYLIMGLLGLCWGLSIPLTRIAVSTGHAPLGLTAWQVIYMSVFLSVVLALRGRRFPSLRRHWPLFLTVALTGTLVPNMFSYTAAAHLPAGVMAIVVALVPMFSLPIALGLGMERWRWTRLGGVLLGALAVVLLTGPRTSLPDPAAAGFVLIALIAPLCYGIEGNFLAFRGTGGLDALQVLWGASLAAMLVAVPVSVASGAWIDPLRPWGPAEWATLLSAVVHGIAYSGYVWLVGAAGSVFAAQVAYLVTGGGVLWSMLLLGERYSGFVWLAFALMIAGVALVQPRGRARRSGLPQPAVEEA